MEGHSDNVGALLAYVYPLSVIATITKTIPELHQNSHFLISLSLSVSQCVWHKNVAINAIFGSFFHRN